MPRVSTTPTKGSFAPAPRCEDAAPEPAGDTVENATAERASVFFDAFARGTVAATAAFREEGYVDFADTLSPANRRRPEDVADAYYRVNVALHAVVEDVRAGALAAEPEELLELAGERLADPAFDFALAEARMKCDPAWSREDRDTFSNIAMITGRSVYSLVAPGAYTNEALSWPVTRTIDRGAERAARADAADRTQVMREANLAVAHAFFTGTHLEDERSGLAPVLPALAYALYNDGWVPDSSATALAAIADVADVFPIASFEPAASADLEAADGTFVHEGVAYAYRAKTPEQIATEVYAKLELGALDTISAGARAQLEEMIGPPDRPGAELAARLEDEASAKVWRRTTGQIIELALISYASGGAGAFAESFAVGAGLGRTGIAGARFAATSASFTTMRGMTTGELHASDYLRDAAMFGVLQKTAALAPALAKLVPGETFSAQLGRFAVAHGASVATTSTVVTGEQMLERLAAGDPVRFEHVRSAMLTNLTVVATLHGTNLAMMKLSPELAPGSAAAAAFDRISAQHRQAARQAEHAIAELNVALSTADLARAERAATALSFARSRARSTGAELVDLAERALGREAAAAAHRQIAASEALLGAGAKGEAQLARAKGTTQSHLSFFSDASARARVFEDRFLAGGPGRTAEGASELLQLSGGLRADAHGFGPGDEIPLIFERLASDHTPAIMIRAAPRNLSGINAKGGHTAGDDFYAAMTELAVQELRLEGLEVYAYRDGAKASLFAAGSRATREAVDRALARATVRIDHLVADSPYAAVEHPRHPGDAAWTGSGMTFARQAIRPGDKLGPIDAELNTATRRYNAEVLGQVGEEVKPEVTLAAVEPRAADLPVRGAQRTPGAPPFLDPVSERRARFVERARAMGVPEQEALELFRSTRAERLDPDTGYHFGEDRMPTLERAASHARVTGENAYYVEMDVRNLGAVNAALGREGAVKEFRVCADMIAGELRAIGADVSLFHHGGDEVSAVLVAPNLAKPVVEAALVRAQGRFAEYMRARGLSELEHPKHPGDATKRGVGFVFAVEQALPGRSPEEVRSAADQQVERIKKGSP